MRSAAIFIGKLTIFFLVTIMLAMLGIAIFGSIPPAAPTETITQKVDLLYEAASIQVPHFRIDKGVLRQEHESVFVAAERGDPLSAETSRHYRQLYQELLAQKQFLFRHYDSQLTILKDHALHDLNNLGGSGIHGEHDHHDTSARTNAQELFESRRWLQANPYKTGFSPRRVLVAIAAYKNLTDILFHLAIVPQTKSVHYQAPLESISDPFEQEFESTLYAFKLAQFERVNSTNYLTYIQQALTHYDQLVVAMQEVIVQNLSPLERKYVGEWGGWQSLTPQVEVTELWRIDRYASVQYKRNFYVNGHNQ